MSPPAAALAAHAPVVVIDSGDHPHVSRGDAAMLKAAIDQVRARWPDARIGVVSSSPTRLALIDRDVQPLLDTHPERWQLDGSRGALGLPGFVLDRYFALTEPQAVRYRLASAVTRVRARAGVPVPTWSERLARSRLRPDVTIGAGGGYLCDMDAPRAIEVLDTIEWARRQGSLTCLFSQGVGPITDQALLERMAAVLPGVDLISLRERLMGRPILRELGVAEDRIAELGDDAFLLCASRPVPLAQRARIGVSLRTASYLALARGDHDWLLEATANAADELHVPIRPVTSCEWRDEDRAPNAAVAKRARAAEPDLARSASPQAFAAAIAGCRVMVTTLYHAALFALAQGSPAVGIARSDYQRGKFDGLRDLFGGEGLTIVDAADAGSRGALREQILAAWHAAERLSPVLSERAERVRRDVLSGYARLQRRCDERRASATTAQAGPQRPLTHPA